ncbi:hypothetical protein AAFF_G00066380 [Aldrovandia affinis]|uniref:Uncharacterized protein n=1 Tax=Aldrovandia affinis TaxID=143900 RepID=A0AAD7T4G9_9TELE|nr:hypothetical protein AAFF_G00066380 [Aldrovandia affinis]
MRSSSASPFWGELDWGGWSQHNVSIHPLTLPRQASRYLSADVCANEREEGRGQRLPSSRPLDPVLEAERAAQEQHSCGVLTDSVRSDSDRLCLPRTRTTIPVL